jgi:hypothetical protein
LRIIRLKFLSECKFEKGIVLVRNPFDAILAAYNHHKAGKTSEPTQEVFLGDAWPRFVQDYIRRWHLFHEEWVQK